MIALCAWCQNLWVRCIDVGEALAQRCVDELAAKTSPFAWSAARHSSPCPCLGFKGCTGVSGPLQPPSPELSNLAHNGNTFPEIQKQTWVTIKHISMLSSAYNSMIKMCAEKHIFNGHSLSPIIYQALGRPTGCQGQYLHSTVSSQT